MALIFNLTTPDMRKVEINHIQDSDNDFGSDDDDSLLGPVLSPTQYIPNPNLETALPRSNLETFTEKPSSITSKPTEKCVVSS
jgi:hypothetical protein